ncbi:hypothetical protein KDM41_09780 [bacterium]|nr:hypothetical protein [bacterium]
MMRPRISRRRLATVLAWVGLAACAACADEARRPDHAPTAHVPAAVAARAAVADRLFPAAVEDSLLAAEQDLPTGARIAAWARRFAAADGVVYRFGPEAGGYVADGALVADHVQDCVSLLYRTTELARARDGRDAVAWALRTRFAGAPIDSVAGADGRVDYDHPAHLDYSLDMIRSGHWGRDITAALTGARPDSAGSSRYPAGSFTYVPGPDLRGDELADGDIVWFVLAPDHPAGAKLRHEYGLVIGHIGIVVQGARGPELVHAARSGLSGRYEGGTVVTVPLAEYLDRVGKFGGVVVTRF